jgi:hypothetical protein
MTQSVSIIVLFRCVTLIYPRGYAIRLNLNTSITNIINTKQSSIFLTALLTGRASQCSRDPVDHLQATHDQQQAKHLLTLLPSERTAASNSRAILTAR